MNAAALLALLDIALLPLAVVTVIGIIQARSLLVSTILLSVYSFLMASLYLILGAPDVSMTEAAVGAGISTVLLLSVLLLVGEREKPSRHRLSSMLVVGLMMAALVYATLDMPRFGAASNVTNSHVTAYYLARTEADIGIPNVVTAVLASYRGYDTLGETFVVFTAAISVLLLIGRFGGKPEKR